MTATSASGIFPLPYRVVGRQAEVRQTVTIDLEPVGAELPPFVPGQFAMVYAFGVGDIPVSVCGTDGTRLSLTIRAVGATSGALHNVRPGEAVGVRGPFGTGWELHTARGRDLLVVAGGIGLAPLRPVVLGALAERKRYGQLNVLIGAREPSDLLYTAQVSGWRKAGVHTLVTVDRPDESWRDDVGVVTMLLDRAAFSPGTTTAFVCGPEVMIRATARELVDRGIPAKHVRVSLERTMHCGVGHCGHCQLGPLLLCRTGPVVDWSTAGPLLAAREL